MANAQSWPLIANDKTNDTPAASVMTTSSVRSENWRMSMRSIFAQPPGNSSNLAGSSGTMCSMKWPQFSLKELFQSLLLISIGLGCLNVFNRDREPSPLIMTIGPFVLFTGPVWIGAGIGTLFHRPIRGGLEGLVVAVGMAMVILLSVERVIRL